MGIRIHKDLGWILESVDLDLEVLSTITLEDLKKENQNNKDLNLIDLTFPNIDLKQTLDKFVTDASDEYTEGDRLYIFQPPFLIESWSRYDCSIDYYEANENAERTIKYLHQEIFPFSQKFVVSSNLKELSEPQTKLCWYFSDNPKVLLEPKQKELEELGLDLSKPLKTQIHMTAPAVLKLILEKCSKVDPKRLRPALVTHWS